MPEGAWSRFLLLYGSQLGQAKSIAEELQDQSTNNGFSADLKCLDRVNKEFNLLEESCVVLITSTTGEGEPPENAAKFCRWLKKLHPPDYLAHLRYTILGLGDTNYTNFCNCGKTFNRRLEELGAKQFYPPGWADDGVGLELVIEPWIEGLWPALKLYFSSVPNTVFCTQIDSGCSVNERSNKRVCQNRILQNMDQKGSPELHLRTGGGDDVQVKDLKYSVQDSANETRTINHSRSEFSNSENVDGVNVVASLRTSSLSSETLTLPSVPPEFLQVEFNSNIQVVLDKLQNDCPLPFAAGEVFESSIIGCKSLTGGNDVPTVLDVCFNVEDCGFEYSPGDTVGIVCPNDLSEIERILTYLELMEKMDTVSILSVKKETTKRNASVPAHLPREATLKHWLSTCVEIRNTPKKLFLRALSEYASDSCERRRLQELCSKQGSSDYNKFVVEPRITILDIFDTFPSCKPPVTLLLEQLPRLQPRPYSICSSPLAETHRLHIVFSVVKIEQSYGRTYSRKGVCTGWLHGLVSPLQSESIEDGIRNMTISSPTVKPGQLSMETVESYAQSHLQGLKCRDVCETSFYKFGAGGTWCGCNRPIWCVLAPSNITRQVPLFPRKTTGFHLPDDPTIPIIMIGPGTGVAPFIGFLQHRDAQIKTDKSFQFGEIWLFFGCRYLEQDFLYRRELDEFVNSGTLTHLFVCSSRDAVKKEDGNKPRYVQDLIRLRSKEFTTQLLDKKSILYVCGDAKNMAKDVFEAVVEVVHKEKEISEKEARGIVADLQINKRYLQDVWT